MVNLEILICRSCYSIEKLPLEMTGLHRLKLLELSRCGKLQSIERGIISSLVGLEELKMQRSFDRWEAEEREERNFYRWEAEEREESENASIRELEALPNLACLEIDICDPSVLTENMPNLSKNIVRFNIRMYIRDIPSKFSKAMSLYLERGRRLGAWIETQLLRDTEYLYTKGGGNNVDLAKSQNIRWLDLSECVSMKNVVRTSGGIDDATVFPSLEHLELYDLPELEEICDGPVSPTSFQNLNELELRDLWALTQFWKSSSVPQKNNVPHFRKLSSIVIKGCYNLRNLGQLSMAGKDCLPQLEQLNISSCLKMEQVFLWKDEEVITKVFPKLKEVELVYLPNLTDFYQGIDGIEFPLLRKMKIEECPKMKSLIESSSADINLHLLISQPQKVSLGNLVVLMIDNIGSMGIFTLSMAANLVSLRVLSIQGCNWIVNVIDEEEKDDRKVAGGGEIMTVVFPKLEELTLKWLPKLVRSCEWKCDVEFPSLTKVEIFQCPNVEKFSMGLVAAPNLKIVQIDKEEIDTANDLNGALHQHYLAHQGKGE